MKKTTKYITAGLIVFMGLLGFPLLIDTFYEVDEGHRGILLRFGKVISPDAGIPPGLHVKRPITDEVKHVNTDVRVYEFSMQNDGSRASRISVKWQVINPNRYYSAFALDDAHIQMLLQRNIPDLLRVAPDIQLSELNLTLVSNFGVAIVEYAVES